MVRPYTQDLLKKAPKKTRKYFINDTENMKEEEEHHAILIMTIEEEVQKQHKKIIKALNKLNDLSSDEIRFRNKRLEILEDAKEHVVDTKIKRPLTVSILKEIADSANHIISRAEFEKSTFQRGK